MKALFVGLGGVGQRHLRNLLRLRPRAEILAVRRSGRAFEIRDDLTPDRSVDIAEKYRIKRFATLAKAAREKPDFAVVSNPTSLHLETAAALVRLGVPVFLEKPISDSEKGLDELARLAARAKVPVMVGLMMRFHPCAERVRELLSAGALGPIHSAVLICHSYVPSWHSYEKPKEFYAGSRALGGGAVLTEIHELDLLHWYFGAPKRVWAAGGKLSGLDIDVEDAASSLLEFEGGGRRFTASVNVSFAQPVPTRRLWVFGERGRLSWDVLKNRVELDVAGRGEPEVFERADFQRNELFVRELSHFLDRLADGSEPRTSLAEALPAHRTALRIRDAVRTSLDRARAAPRAKPRRVP